MYSDKTYLQAGAGWFVLSTIFLTLPGTSFPSENWLSVVNFDKIVHVSIFSGMVILFCWGIYKRSKNLGKKINTAFIICTLLAILYGVIIEYVQKYFIPNRSFDVTDIVADSIGAIAGWIFSIRAYIKK